MAAWRETPEGEWWQDDLGVVIGVRGTVWFGYPETGCARIGPFASLLEAQRALERERSRGGGGGDGDDSARIGDTDDDRPTQKRARPSAPVASAGAGKR